MEPAIDRANMVCGFGIEHWCCSDRCRVRTDSRSLCNGHARWLKRLCLRGTKRRRRRDADRSMAQDAADIVPLQHLETIADHARLQNGIRVGIDRVLDRETLQSSQLHHARS